MTDYWQSIFYYYRPGGLLIWIIFSASTLMWFLIVERLLFFRGTDRQGLEASSDALCPRGPFAQVVQELTRSGLGANAASFDEILGAYRPSLQRFESWIAVLAAILPLMGLLGTVAGMMVMFGAMSELGLRDTHEVSQGISQALLTTQVGLMTALPGVFFLERIRRQRLRVERELVTFRSQLIREQTRPS